jgi:hypothetical protein
VRNGTAKVLTLFRPADGRVRVGGVTSYPNAVLHPWLKRELTAVLAALPPVAPLDPPTAARAAWERWQAGLKFPITLPAVLPPLRVLLVLDNLAGHRTPEFVLWLFAHGVMAMYPPAGRVVAEHGREHPAGVKGGALDGQNPTHTDQIIGWFEAAAAHWNDDPTPFEWGGQRAARWKR